jgi:hypothetical protein
VVHHQLDPSVKPRSNSKETEKIPRAESFFPTIQSLSSIFSKPPNSQSSTENSGASKKNTSQLKVFLSGGDGVLGRGLGIQRFIKESMIVIEWPEENFSQLGLF